MVNWNHRTWRCHHKWGGITCMQGLVIQVTTQNLGLVLLDLVLVLQLTEQNLGFVLFDLLPVLQLAERNLGLVLVLQSSQVMIIQSGQIIHVAAVLLSLVLDLVLLNLMTCWEQQLYN